MAKKRMSNGAFLGIWCSVAASVAWIALRMVKVRKEKRSAAE